MTDHSPMIVKLYGSTQHGEVRTVMVPNDAFSGTLTDVMDAIFKHGQNDVQPVPHTYSVSMGDIIPLWNPDGSTAHYRVQSSGFKLLSADQFEYYSNLPLNRRFFECFNAS
jgi:hypothetical protein